MPSDWRARDAEERGDRLIEKAEAQQWEAATFPEPTPLIRQQDREYRNELARLEQLRARREKEARSV